MAQVEEFNPDISVIKRVLVAVQKIPAETPSYWKLVTDFGFKKVEEKPSSEQVRVLVENLKFLDSEALTLDGDLLKELIEQEGFEGNQLGIVLVSNRSTCKLCGGDLLVRADRPSFLTGYTDTLGTIPITHFRKYCNKSKRGCPFTQHYGFHSTGEDTDVIYDDDWSDLPFFMSTNKTAFEMRLLKGFSAELLIGQVSYNQRSDIYNYVHGYEKKCKTTSTQKAEPVVATGLSKGSIHSFSDRLKLDRRRLEEGHMKFCVLDVYGRYPTVFPKLLIRKSMKMTLEEVTPLYFKAFEDKCAMHQCNYPGCDSVLVLDGNLKNRRDVCSATGAGYVQYSSLPGAIKTGCQESPCATSKFCYYHAPRVSQSAGEMSSRDSATEARGMQIITAVRETRGQKYYEVATFGEDQVVSWVEESNVSKSLIAEFERSTGILTENKYGLINHTLVKSHHISDSTQPPPSKQLRLSSSWNAGAFVDHPLNISCNTEKDKSIRLHQRTAGILAAMRPCGTVIYISELFVSESKSQVYASIHEYLNNHANVLHDLKFICYNDGCHLLKYARHPSHKDLTRIATKLADIRIVVDKLHMQGHTDQWCHSNCDPYLFPELNNVDTEVCEQCFSWLSQYAKITRRMNRCNFIFLLLYLCDLHNSREEDKLRRSGYLIS